MAAELTTPPYTVPCPTCGAPAGVACTSTAWGRVVTTAPHRTRRDRWRNGQRPA